MKAPLTGSQPGQTGEGPSLHPSLDPPALETKLQGLILWRLAFLSLLLFLTVLLRDQERLFGFPVSFFPFYFLLSLQYLLSLIYLLLLRRRRGGKGLALFQLAVDGLFVSALVHLTGGGESFLSFLYFLVILAGGILFNRPGGMGTATYAFVSYALILFLPRGWVSFVSPWPERAGTISWRYALYLLTMNGIGFYFVGYLGSLFAEQTRRQYREIEEQKKNIARLEQWNRLVVENLDMGLLTLDRDLRILTINPAGERILRRPAAALIGHSLTDFFFLAQEKEKGQSGEEEGRRETRYTPPDGDPLVIGFSLYRVREEAAGNSEIGTIVTFKDISGIKAMEERLRQMDRLALMGRMAAGIAHEIRNPLASISGSLQLFREAHQDPETGEQLLRIISRELNKLDSLINDFLTFSRPVQPPPQPLNVSQLIKDTLTLFQKGKEMTPEVRFRIEVEEDLFLKLPGRELSRILWNLLTNAREALPGEGEITVRAGKIRNQEGGDYLEIVIGDEGCGISEEDLARIFEPFYTTKEKGTGLGLSIVQKIVSDLGGRIGVESRPGEGTIFSLHFPVSSG